MRAAVPLAVVGLALVTVLATVPAQAQPPPGPGPDLSCIFHPHPAIRQPVDEHDDHLVHDADQCTREHAGQPLPARADVDAECNAGPYLFPDCVQEAQARCEEPPIDPTEPCDPAQGTSAWANASALDEICLDCAPDVRVAVHHENLTHTSAEARVTLGLYNCRAAVGPGGDAPVDGPVPGYEAEATCLPLPVPGPNLP